MSGFATKGIFYALQSEWLADHSGKYWRHELERLGVEIPTSGSLSVNMNNIAAKVRVTPSDKSTPTKTPTKAKGNSPAQWGSGYGMFRTFILEGEPFAVYRSTLGRRWCRRHRKGNDCLAGSSRVHSRRRFRPCLQATSAWPARSLPAGGLVFIGGTVRDPEFRAFDVATGEELWKTSFHRGRCPVPMSYQLKPGEQFAAVAAGGHGNVGKLVTRSSHSRCLSS